jgi:transposase InsO family protein
VRAAIRASDEPAWVLAERHGISEQTVWKWRKRGDVQDRSHTPHRLQTTLTPAQEAVAVALRTMLLLPLDDLLAVVREFVNPNVSRSGLDRCLRRHGVGNLRELKPKAAKPTHKPFKAYEPGYLHIDVKYLPQMADEERRRYLFVAIDRATRWVFIRIYSAKTAANARRFLRDLDRAAPMKITRVLTDNGREFTDRLFGLRRRHATGAHQVDLLCAELGIDHRLAPPMRPQTNGMVERFNGRIEDVLQSHRFRSGEDLEQTILRYVQLYNSQLPQTVLKGRTPIGALKDWHRQKPELFKKRPYNHPGCDSKEWPRPLPLRSLECSGARGRVMRRPAEATTRSRTAKRWRTSPRASMAAVGSGPSSSIRTRTVSVRTQASWCRGSRCACRESVRSVPEKRRGRRLPNRRRRPPNSQVRAGRSSFHR